MKKLVSILSLVLAITFGVQAQEKKDGKRVKLSEEQQTNLAIKKMTLALDLSEKQQAEIKPILMAKAAERKSMMEQRKADREAKKRPTDSEVYKKRMSHLDNQIAMKKKMKSILNKEQFEKFEKMQKRRNLKEMHQKKNKKKGKGDKRGAEHRENN
ncbi:Spy/CpxP family protein refolding chaperone [uncultured Polaribacter sp.]|uniref:Spy/CpxP family protein refolding chaperone n=1 Tax=uncultured Polaribacter sp. TaxID=174711 RepID=UPI002621C321|nr:Spy/CpxP family protein refolding chaperone [uncultured Polaribacter sp.]